MYLRDFLTQTLGEDSDLRTVILSIVCSVAKISESLDISKGKSDSMNFSGDHQLEMDVQADIIIHDTLLEVDQISMLASEEREEAVILNGDKFAVVYDPLDGSSLIDANFTIGSIFGVFPGTHIEGRTPGEMSAALIAVYGPKTTVTLSFGSGVHEFILTEDGFELNRENIKLDLSGKFFAPGNLRACKTEEWYKDLVDYWLEEQYTLRYSGGMVPDINHILVKQQGVFTYPGYAEAPEGKLRLLYECGPMSYLIVQAGGAATDGVEPILDKKINTLHQRSPIFIGSAKEVEKVVEMYSR